MAGGSRKLKVSISPKAFAALDEIWIWNCQTYGAEHAHGYVDFLIDQANNFGATFFLGKPVPKYPNFNYLVIRRRQARHGHLAVYEVIDDVINVLTFYHTAQDWQNKLIEEFELGNG